MAYSVNFNSEGESVDYTPGSAVAAGEIVSLKGLVGIATTAIAASAKGSLAIRGIFAVPKKDEAFAAGLPVWFDANGDPKVGTAGTGAATQIGGDAQAAADVLLGTCVVAAAAADEFVYVDINVFRPSIPTFAGAARITKTTGNAAATESGVCYDCTADNTVVTLPATAVGLEFTVMNMAADGGAKVSVDFQSGDKSLGGLGVAAGGDGYQIDNTKATAKKGDFITFVADGTDGYRIKAMRGTWAQTS